MLQCDQIARLLYVKSVDSVKQNKVELNSDVALTQ